jgi:hypothetical protein
MVATCGSAGAGQVVEEAGEGERPAHRAGDDHGAEAPAAHQQALTDQGLDRLAQGGPADRELVGELDLVVQPAAGGQRSGGDRLLQLLGDLEIERHRTVPVDDDPVQWDLFGALTCENHAVIVRHEGRDSDVTMYRHS